MFRMAVQQRAEKATYAQLADEYYNSARHPTCASLRELSFQYLRGRLGRMSAAEGLLLEVGAGKSILAPACVDLGLSFDRLLLTDSSAEMLAYSAEWEAQGARLQICEAAATGLQTASVGVAVCSLGDPYNTADLWREVARVLRPGGVCHFTTPSFEWAARFRSPDQMELAEFIRGDGARLYVPSHVPDEFRQLRMINDAGLEVIDAAELYLRDLNGPPAPKLLCAGTDPVVRGLTVRR